MRSKTVLRFYCDHCSRGGFRKKDMQKHEDRCIYNPLRKCFLCEDARWDTPPMTELITAIETSLSELRHVTEGCPACMLAAIVQSRGEIRTKGAREDAWVDFDYKKELSDYHAESVGASSFEF